MQLKFRGIFFSLSFYCMFFHVQLKCNLLYDMDVLYPYFVLGDYILLSFSCTIHKPTIFWPNSCISYVLTYILFFFCSPLPYFSSALLFPFPISSFSLCTHLPFPRLFPNSHTLPYPILCIPCLHPCLHPLCSCFCAWTKCSSDQLAPINRLEPWSMTTSPFCGNHPSLWMICSSPLFLDSSLFLSYAACSSLLLKMVTPQSLFTLFGMLSLALYFYYWFNYLFHLNSYL